MIIIALAFLLGMLISYLFFRKKLINSKKDIVKLKTLFVDKLTSAYDEIEKLKIDNKYLINQLNFKNNEGRHNN